MKKIVKKLKSRRGETITETLVALLIASIALVMLELRPRREAEPGVGARKVIQRDPLRLPSA